MLTSFLYIPEIHHLQSARLPTLVSERPERLSGHKGCCCCFFQILEEEALRGLEMFLDVNASTSLPGLCCGSTKCSDKGAP